MPARKFSMVLVVFYCAILHAGAMDLGGFGQLFSQWFEINVPFSADLTADDGDTPMKVKAKFYMQNGAFRCEMDMRNIDSPQKSDEAAERAARDGLDYLVSLGHPNSKRTVLFPLIKSYYQQDSSAAIAKAFSEIKLQKVQDGEETIDGHRCSRVKMFLPNDPNPAIAWHATDLQNFPVQLQISTLRLNFRNVKFGPQDTTLFTIPGNYKRYNNIEQLTEAARMARESEQKKKLAEPGVVEFQKERAAKGSPIAQYDLGLRYWEGRGVKKDEYQAFEWMERSAAGGNNQAKAFLSGHPKPPPLPKIESPPQTVPAAATESAQSKEKSGKGNQKKKSSSKKKKK
jgi:hypothetical protein